MAILAGCNQNEQQISKFKNTQLEYKTDMGVIWEIIKERFTIKRVAPEPTSTMPVKPLTFAEIQQAKENSAVKLGHSSMLLKINSQIILLDPVFSDRASPVQWAGPKRFHQTPITLDELEYIDVIVISHDHYDHLDKGTIKALNQKVGHFVVPLKIGKYLLKWGVSKDKITELDWWQEHQLNGVTYIATPTQHFSGRGLFDRDETLWASWVIQSEDVNIYFSGDSGYFSGFKEIGNKYGPFDLTLVETGAYNKLWKEIHMMPEESVQAHLDLQGKVMMPIHNATFDLAMHDWDEPLERVSELAKTHNIELATPVFGDIFEIQQVNRPIRWWRLME
ncbi:MBL fold metallo-hydrolase [Thalassotalea euphylliae]|uniref:MBL fold metallo-hydrolase n=1 Tax=Thalassotalea euphylliae TaxID=1655234 RepID=UPI00363D387E